MAIESINPVTGTTNWSYPETPPADRKRLVQQADAAFREWRRIDFSHRAARMQAVARLLRIRRDDYAKLMALEMGKPFAQGQSEAEKCAWVCEYFAEHTKEFLSPETISTEAFKSLVAFQPLGVILAVMPWNFPFWQVFRCAAPGLMAGNAIILKHASNVPGCALAIEKIFHEAGFPEGLLSTVLMPAADTETLIANPLVTAVTLTGSVPAGRAIAAQAGAHLKKTVLELGGSDPYVVLADCDLEPTVATCVKSRLLNSGQSCIAAKRFIVVEAIRPQFEKLFVAQMEAAKTGDPMDLDTTVGPLAREDLRDELHRQVQRSVDQGATLLTGGQVPPLPGWFYPPTVLSGVRPGMAVEAEETFGPVAAILSARDEAEAIQLANHSNFGLGAAVFTRDREHGERLATEQLEAGNCFVNDLVKSDPRLPFGGIKQSGYGRELSLFGIREFVNIKTVYVK